MNSNDHFPDDAELVAWLDGELPSATAAAVASAVANDATLQGKVALLRAAQQELACALQEPESATTSVAAPGRSDAQLRDTVLGETPSPGEALHAQPTARRQLGLWLMAAAGVLVVVALSFLARTEPNVAAANEWLEFRVRPTRPGWQLFSGIQFDLEGRSQQANRPCRIFARKPGETTEQLATRVQSDRGNQNGMPLVLDAEVTGPDGYVRRGAVVRVEGEFGPTTTSLRVELVDVVLPHAGVNPLVAAALQENGWTEDFRWGMTRVGGPDLHGAHGFVPELVGEYRISFSLRPLLDSRDVPDSPAPPDAPHAPGAHGRTPPFAEPLTASTGFSVRGVIGDWSLPQDGMCARIAASAARSEHGAPLAIAVQLQNESDRPRRYNVTGVTMVAIPQPFHFDLVIDGKTCRQRDDLGVIIPARSEALPQPVGTQRTVVVLADYWQAGEAGGAGSKPLSQLTGKHQVAIRFHFQALTWDAADQELWQGQIETPAVQIDFGQPR